MKIEDLKQCHSMRPTTSVGSSVSDLFDVDVICRLMVVVRTPSRKGVLLLNMGSPCSSVKTVLRTPSEESVRIMRVLVYRVWCMRRFRQVGDLIDGRPRTPPF